jgi:hypothetical protein
MSEQPPRSPIIAFALSLAATVKCCSGNTTTNTETVISGNSKNNVGDPTQTVSALQRNVSNMSTDLPVVAEEPEPVVETQTS